MNLREGSARRLAPREALESLQYNGWVTIDTNGSLPSRSAAGGPT